jgi:hypothetical protein
VHLQFAPVRLGELAKGPLIAGAGLVEGALLHDRILPRPTDKPGSVPFAADVVSEQLNGSPTDPDQEGRAIMTDTTSPALQTALAYYQAWTSHDLDTAMSYIAEDIVCDAPAGRLEGAEAYRGFMGPFVQILTGSTMIAAFGDDETAMVMYDIETVPVKSAPGAECVTVKDSKITYSRFVFDRVPFDAARQAAS